MPEFPTGLVRSTLAAFLVAALSTATGAFALDIDAAVRLAATRNERAGAAAAAREAAEARLERARSFFFPSLNATGSYTRRAFETTRTVDGQPFTIQSRNALQADFSFSLPLFDARSIPLYRQAAREATAARLDATDSVRLLSFEAADAFLATIGSEQVRDAAERRVEFAGRSVQDARVRFEAGLTGSNDVSRAALELATAERAVAEARVIANAARLELGNLLDDPIATPLEPPEALFVAAAAPLAGDSSLVAEAIHRRPDLAARREIAAARGFSAQEPLLRALPRFEFGAETGFTNERGLSGRDRDWSLGVNLAWPLYDGGERYAERAERRAQATIAQLEVRARERSIALDVGRARVALEQSSVALGATEAALDAARRNAAETTELYRQGLARAIEVADASIRLFEAEVALTGAQFSQGRAFLDLRAALGLDPLGSEP